MAPETFSSEIGDVHERRGQRESFSDEFRGASDSLLADERPPQPLDVGRRGRRLMFVLILVIGILGGGGFAFWYWSEAIGEWIAGLGRDTPGDADAAPAEPEPEPEPEQEAEPGPEKVFGVPGIPGDDEGGGAGPTSASGAGPEPGGDAPEPEAGPKPAGPSTKVEVTATNVRGKVSSGRVSSRLARVDEALEVCWSKAAASSSTSVELELGFRIKWNGRAQNVSVTGGSDGLRGCVRDALPSGGWPQPRDGGDARVTRKWKLGG